MNDAVKLKCPSCGHERVVWLSDGQTAENCTSCGASIPIPHPIPQTDAGPQPRPDSTPGRLDVSLPPEPVKAPFSPTAYAGYPPPPQPYGRPMLAPHIPMPRNVMPVATMLALMTLFLAAWSLIQFLTPQLLSPSTGTGGRQTINWNVFTWVMIGSVITLALVATYFTLLLIWTYRTHQDLEALTRGTHSPSPGLAMGLLFVPLMHPFWLWHVLRRLSARVSEVNDNEATIGILPLMAFLVASALQVLAQIPGFIFAQHVQESGVVTMEFRLFQLAVAGLNVAGLICLLVALAAIGNAVARYTANAAPAWTPGGQGGTYPQKPYAKSY